MHPAAVFFNLYYPEREAHLARNIFRDTGSAAYLTYSDFKERWIYFNDLGEINPNYAGLKTMDQKFILLMADQKNCPLGFCAFKMHKIDLVEIDIILVRKEMRGMGLGKKLYGHLEQSFTDGTAFYVENTTHSGKLFFKSCGFFRDVDLIKVVEHENRLKKFYREANGNLWVAC
ncbi:Acetyltransferase (GNAT) domain-containing protein [Desulfotomaculum arcticum]|uniref:Acetyltransferase (GNAT) domain-containing protein n=1 Tax=Desulfotruncus arcticus DSM 17038 TaxID=1121424 RepID=A0A1I2YX04_9FIRM|nr:GNAT family N-acetyltransferase [Desulfotruncus arcticus]SFH30208.1 Acetyltransferase (GNAT) domain-containing protein [Desulfotomaculum arcticum] [Desulfotruncus arcticus DSM 17038]